jgi:putative thioredoxin
MTPHDLTPQRPNLGFMVFDVGAEEFEQRVVERSRDVPVIVDFWAEWCGPCRQLSPALEKSANARGGEIDLAKVDVDANQSLAAGFGVQGIPAVKAFKDGGVVDEFVGAIPPAQVEEFFNRLVPSEADRLAAADDEDSLRRALELDPGSSEAARKLGRILIARGETDEALSLLEGVDGDFEAAGLAARIQLEGSENGSGDDYLAASFAAWDDGDHATALEGLQSALAGACAAEERRDLIRRVMVAIFTELGPGNPVAAEHRRRLAAALH